MSNLFVLLCLLPILAFPQEKTPKASEVKTLLESNNRNERAKPKQYLMNYDYDISGAIYEILRNDLKTSQRVGTRANIAKILGKDMTVDISEKVPLILELLKQECIIPLSSKPTGYVTGSEFLKRQYLFAVEKMGTESVVIIQNMLNSSEGEFRDRLIIILGFLEHNEVFSDVLYILENSEDGFLRQLAAMALGKIGDKGAIPALTNALQDTFKRENITDVKRTKEQFIFPVRDSACGVLNILGVKCKRRGWEFWIEE